MPQGFAETYIHAGAVREAAAESRPGGGSAGRGLVFLSLGVRAVP